MSNSKKDYVPSHKREGFDESKVRKLRPYKNFKWTGKYFNEGASALGGRRRDK
jgi:hypothetical protein